MCLNAHTVSVPEGVKLGGSYEQLLTWESRRRTRLRLVIRRD